MSALFTWDLNSVTLYISYYGNKKNVIIVLSKQANLNIANSAFRIYVTVHNWNMKN